VFVYQLVPRFAAIHTLCYVRPSIEFITFRGAGYGQIKARCRQLCEIAEELECPSIVVVPSPTPRDESGEQVVISWDEIVDESVKVLRDLATIAGPHGVSLAFEFLGFGWCSVRTLAGCWEIVRQVDHPNVGLVLDGCHFYAGGSELAEIGLLDPQKLFIFHLDDCEALPKEALTDAQRLFPGQGVLPLDKICAQLANIGYDGLCSVELFRPEYWDWEPARVARQARQAALKVLEPYFMIE
jgi:2-keto-myo-inositol isomerase